MKTLRLLLNARVSTRPTGAQQALGPLLNFTNTSLSRRSHCFKDRVSLYTSTSILQKLRPMRFFRCHQNQTLVGREYNFDSFSDSLSLGLIAPARRLDRWPGDFQVPAGPPSLFSRSGRAELPGRKTQSSTSPSSHGHIYLNFKGRNARPSASTFRCDASARQF
jgi:hypothetical protein